MLGRPVIGATGVSYTETQEKTNVYARGVKPVARTRTNKEYEGEVQLLQSELEALQETAGKGNSINDIPPFDITVVYNGGDNGALKTDILKACEFNKVEKSIEQGDSNMEISLPIIIGDIKYNQ